MAGKKLHLSKTDLRRGLFTKVEAPPAVSVPAAPAYPGAISADEQALLFDLAAFSDTPAPVAAGKRKSSAGSGGR